MTRALSPPTALERLSEMSPHVREAIVLDSRGRRVAGAGALAAPARALLKAAPAATELEVAASRGVVYAARSPRHAIAVVSGRGALPALMLYDLRMLLAQMDGTL
jgi:hypothetical protein